MRVVLRLNDKSDKDLIEYLSNCKNVSKGVRTAMRKGISVQFINVPQQTPQQISLDLIQVEEVAPINETVSEDDIINNLLGTASFFQT